MLGAYSGLSDILIISNPLLFYKKSFDQQLLDALELAGFSMFGLTILFLYQLFPLTADVCHVYSTKHGSDLSIVGSYITFAPFKMFISMTVIILC